MRRISVDNSRSELRGCVVNAESVWNLVATAAERESSLLAPYASFSAQSAGREFAEPEHPYRGPFQRDRDRILHSSAYRRLSGKMQVFTGEMGDYHRTRLTHTQEVATIARTIGRAIRLNEDLIEALALVHDVGHPPYGHAGEDVLDACLRGEGGFSHNQYALTLVRELEQRFTTFPGLNLTREVLAGQWARVDKSDRRGTLPLEVQLVDAADSMAYDAHDTDDALKLGLVSLDALEEVRLVRECLEYVRARYPALDMEMLRKGLVHRLIEYQVTDLLTHTAEELERRRFRSQAEALASDFRIQPSPAVADLKREWEQFLYRSVYRHPTLIVVRERAQARMERMFAGYLRHPEWIPDQYQRRISTVGLPRAAADYIAGMTEKFFEDTHRRHFGDDVD